MTEREAIVETIDRLFIAVDRRDWVEVRASFAPRVQFDMTSLAGGAPTARSGAEIAADWERALADVDHVHHQSGNYLVDVHGDDATAFCYAVAYHHTAQTLRMFVGSYQLHLVRTAGRWHIDAFKFDLRFVHPPR